jgi:hypothetical protein
MGPKKSRCDILNGITQRWACPPMSTYVTFLNAKKNLNEEGMAL